MANLLLCASSSFSRILVRRNRGCQDSLVFVEASYFVRSFNEFGCLTFFLTSRSRMSSRRISQDKSDWLIERDGGMEMVQSFAYSYDIGNQVRFASQCWALIITIRVAGRGWFLCSLFFTGVKSLIFLGSHGFVPVVNVFFSSLLSRVANPMCNCYLQNHPT